MHARRLVLIGILIVVVIVAIRRNLPGNFKESFRHGADGMGVHATGAGFENQDPFQYADWKESTEWLDYQEAMSGKVAA